MIILNDEYYIDLVLKGDVNAFAVLIDRYKEMVFTLAFKILKNREEAEEVSQDAFLKAFKSLSTFKGYSKFSTWLYKVIYNTCLDHLKKNKRAPVLVAMDESVDYDSASLINVLDTLEENERIKMIRHCLSLLPGEDNFLLTLYYLRQHSIEEISQIININANNIKIKLYRSRKKLISLLKTNYNLNTTVYAGKHR